MRAELRKSTRAGKIHLARVRGVVSTAALLLLIAGSIPLGGLLDRAAAVVVHAQLLPSLLRLREQLTVGAGVALFVFPLVITLTAAFGRGYCSSVCPLGTLQDGALRLSRTLFNTRLRFRKPYGALRTAAFAFVVVSWIAGSALPLTLLEPYSIVSRVLSLVNGPAASTLRPLSGEEGVPTEARGASAAHLAPAVLSAALLLFVAATAAKSGRLFCNTLCPAGALLSLPSRYSILRIRISKDRCNGCGRCEHVCPARCIDVRSAHVFSGSCTLCFSCLDACTRGALWYGARGFST